MPTSQLMRLPFMDYRIRLIRGGGSCDRTRMPTRGAYGKLEKLAKINRVLVIEHRES